MTDLTVYEPQEQVISIMPSVQETAKQAIDRQLALVNVITTLVDETFKEGIDYGKIADMDKETLFLPGIEKTMGLLGLRESFRDIHTERQFDTDNPFFYYEVECILYHSQSGLEVATGQGICHTREKSFMRQQDRVCPNCEKDTIKKSKFPPRDNQSADPGWYCYAKIGGCGMEFSADDNRITGQAVGNFNDPQLVWDGLNRARKIANKRAKADAVKRIGMLSGRFTVDVEDFAGDPPSSKSEPTPPHNGNDFRGTNGTTPKTPNHWTQDTTQSTNFYALCKDLPYPPLDKAMIAESLDVISIGDFKGTLNDAVKTVDAHMKELLNIPERRLQYFVDRLWKEDDVQANYNAPKHVENTIKLYHEIEKGGDVDYPKMLEWIVNREHAGKTNSAYTKTSENSQNGDKPASMDDIPF